MCSYGLFVRVGVALIGESKFDYLYDVVAEVTGSNPCLLLSQTICTTTLAFSFIIILWQLTDTKNYDG